MVNIIKNIVLVGKGKCSNCEKDKVFLYRKGIEKELKCAKCMEI